MLPANGQNARPTLLQMKRFYVHKPKAAAQHCCERVFPGWSYGAVTCPESGRRVR